MPALAPAARPAGDAGAPLLPLALGLVGLSLALTMLAPLWLLLLAPLLLGAPHLVSDLRYLVVRPPGTASGLDRAPLLALALPLLALTALRGLGLAGGPTWPAAEAVLGGAAVVGAVAAGGGSTARRAAALALALAVVALGWLFPDRVALGLAHLHNLVAIALWLTWARGRTPLGARVAVVLAIAVGAGAIALGACDRLLLATGGLTAPSSGLGFGSMAALLAPGLAPLWAVRVVLLYAFAQALHYVVWLALIPRLATPRRSLRQDLGALPLALAIAVSLAVPLAGFLAPARVRAIYLSLVLFHGWLELAVIAHLWTRRQLRARVA